MFDVRIGFWGRWLGAGILIQRGFFAVHFSAIILSIRRVRDVRPCRGLADDCYNHG